VKIILLYMGATSFEQKAKMPAPQLERFQHAVAEGLTKDGVAFDANKKLTNFNQQRDNHWNLSKEGEQGINNIIQQFDQANQKILGGLAVSYRTEMQAKSDLYEAIILKAQSMLPEATLRGLEDQIIKAAKEKNFQNHTKDLENLVLLNQIWNYQLSALEIKTDLSEAEKYKKIKLVKYTAEAQRIIRERSIT
jgi:hypothetical protein